LPVRHSIVEEGAQGAVVSVTSQRVVAIGKAKVLL